MLSALFLELSLHNFRRIKRGDKVPRSKHKDQSTETLSYLLLNGSEYRRCVVGDANGKPGIWREASQTLNAGKIKT